MLNAIVRLERGAVIKNLLEAGYIHCIMGVLSQITDVNHVTNVCWQIGIMLCEMPNSSEQPSVQATFLQLGLVN